jgi:hypothetical protein
MNISSVVKSLHVTGIPTSCRGIGRGNPRGCPMATRRVPVGETHHPKFSGVPYVTSSRVRKSVRFVVDGPVRARQSVMDVVHETKWDWSRGPQPNRNG